MDPLTVIIALVAAVPLVLGAAAVARARALRDRWDVARAAATAVADWQYEQRLKGLPVLAGGADPKTSSLWQSYYRTACAGIAAYLQRVRDDRW